MFIESLVKLENGKNTLFHALAVILDANIHKGETVRIVHLERRIILDHLNGVAALATCHEHNRSIAPIFQMFGKPKMTVMGAMLGQAIVHHNRPDGFPGHANLLVWQQRLPS